MILFYAFLFVKKKSDNYKYERQLLLWSKPDDQYAGFREEKSMKKHLFIISTMLVLSLFVVIASSTELAGPSETTKVLETVIPYETPIVNIEQQDDSTKLEISPKDANLRIQPGEKKEVTVIVKNKDKNAVIVMHKVVIPTFGMPLPDKDWIKIKPGKSEISPNGSQNFVVNVSLPKDANIGNYNVIIAFNALYPGQILNYANFNLSIDVWTPPKILISPMYIKDQLEAMKEYDYEIKLKNEGDKEIAINPIVGSDGFFGPYGMPPAFNDSAITITGPNSITANAIETVKVHIRVPNSSGYYNGYIDFGINDPSMPENLDRVNLTFNIWKQPTDYFIKKFSLERDSPITIEMSSFSYGMYMADNEKSKPSFEAILKGPDGTSNLKSSKKVIKGSVILGGEIPPWDIHSKNIYQETGIQYIETYTVNGTAGKYILSILPIKVPEFEYSITIGGS